MAKCVALKCEVKAIFDPALKTAVLKQIRQSVQTLVDQNKSKGLFFDNNCKDGCQLTVTVVALEVDNKDKPTTIEAKVFIGGVRFGSSTKGSFNANGSSKAAGVNAKKMAQEAAAIVKDAVEDLMTTRVLPQMLKP